RADEPGRQRHQVLAPGGADRAQRALRRRSSAFRGGRPGPGHPPAEARAGVREVRAPPARRRRRRPGPVHLPGPGDVYGRPDLGRGPGGRGYPDVLQPPGGALEELARAGGEMTRMNYRSGAPEPVSFEMPAMNPSADPVTVLVVDDDADQRFLVQRRLETAGVEVRTAAGAEEALDSLDGVDLVLLDYLLPGASGLEILPQIREQGPSVVMLTGMGSEGLAVEAMRQGAVDYIVKDSSYLELLPQVVERAWRHHDLFRRAGELERIGLLVTSATDRTEVFSEIVAGARRLLRADGCALFVQTDGDLVLEAGAGELQGARDRLLAEARGTMSGTDVGLEPTF